jgi:hypothetical protein
MNNFSTHISKQKLNGREYSYQIHKILKNPTFATLLQSKTLKS